MTTNQMVKLFTKILKDVPPAKLSANTMKQLKEISDTIKKCRN